MFGQPQRTHWLILYVSQSLFAIYIQIIFLLPGLHTILTQFQSYLPRLRIAALIGNLSHIWIRVLTWINWGSSDFSKALFFRLFRTNELPRSNLICKCFVDLHSLLLVFDYLLIFLGWKLKLKIKYIFIHNKVLLTY